MKSVPKPKPVFFIAGFNIDDERVVAPSVQIAAEVEDLELVGDVQEGGGLVEEKQRGLLGQDEGEPGALALTAGELVYPGRQIGRASCRERV